MKLLLRCSMDKLMIAGQYVIKESFGGNGIEPVAVAVQGPDRQEFVRVVSRTSHSGTRRNTDPHATVIANSAVGIIYLVHRKPKERFLTKKHLLQTLSTGVLTLLLAFAFGACGSTSTSNSSSVTVHLGYFPNITHAVALVGVERGTFKNALGPNVNLQTMTFSAGPALIEALFAGQIDIGYVGPNPAINGYVQSHGAALRIIAGASSGGALFVVRPGANIKTAADLANKKLATPQLGGTQDIALRYYLQQHGLKTADKGGNVHIIPTAPATILNLFKQGTIDGAWVAEPWATRLIVEAKAQVFVDERSLWTDGKFVTTNVVVRKAFLDAHPDLVQKFLQAHVDTVQYILSNPTAAQAIVNSEIKRITGQALTSTEISMAFANQNITYDPLGDTLLQSADRAYSLGYLGTSKPDLSGIYYLGPLNQVLTNKGLASVAQP